MGHRLSKTTLTGSNTTTSNKSQRKRSSTNADNNVAKREVYNTSSSNLNSSGPTINVITDTQTFCFETCTDSSSSSNGPRQIIIKIQLPKMEPDGKNITSPSTSSPDDVTESNNNLNVERSNITNAISFHRNISCDQGNEVKLNNLNGGSSMMLNNNNFVSNFTSVPYIKDESGDARNRTNLQNFNIMVRKMGNCQIIDNVVDSRQSSNNNGSSSNRSSTSSGEFSDDIVDAAEEECSPSAATVELCGEAGKNHCCRRKKSSSSASTACSSSNSSSTAYPSKWRCCKCTCRDALKKLRPSCSKKQNQITQKTTSQLSETQPLAVALTTSSEFPRTNTNHLALWSPDNDVIIPLTSPQLVVVQYPNESDATQKVSLAQFANQEEHAISLRAIDLTIPTTPDSPSSSKAISPYLTSSSATTPNDPIVHSQVDYSHWLVRDLQKITNATYYWGKMDRYEAERLLEGKPEGTFLLRDSAQEEYLFSVTFRKYGRSLHARIEQFNHQFSFDCHDPGVHTAPTVTGLLEHYKDPSIVMFFEPMLTIPLHRNKTFSLQKLCRATIVSHTTYNGVSELEIPIRLKSYLKEYHYKQRERVKPFDEPFYTCA